MTMKINRKFIFIIGLPTMFFLMIFISTYSQPSQSQVKYDKKTLEEAEKVIRDAFFYQNNHDLTKVKDLYSSRYSNSTFRLDNLISIQILELKLLKNEINYRLYLDYGPGRVNNIERKNLIIYKVRYNIEFKDQTLEPIDSGEYQRAYSLIRENNIGNWKIDDIGIDYYD